MGDPVADIVNERLQRRRNRLGGDRRFDDQQQRGIRRGSGREIGLSVLSSVISIMTPSWQAK